MPVGKVINPYTGRKIKVGGPTHKKLMSEKRGRSRSRSPKRLGKATPSPLRKTLSKTPRSRKAKRRGLLVMIAREGSPRGARTRGWRAASPQRGRERQTLMAKCGKECFLQPESLGFPICPAPREGKGCKVDCRGLTAAYIRAKQYKHESIAKKAKSLMEKYKC